MWDNSNMQEDIEWGNIPVGNMTDEELYKKHWNKVEGRRNALANPVNREKYYDNKEWLENCAKKRSQSLKTPEVSAKLSASHKKRYENIEERKKTSEASKRSHKDPIRKEKQKNASKITWSKTEVKKKASESHKKQWADPKKRKQLSSSMKEIRKYPIMTPDGEFESTQAAAEHYGISRDMIGYFRRKYPDQYYYSGRLPHSNKKK